MNRYVFTPGFAIAALAVLWILTWGAPLAQEGTASDESEVRIAQWHRALDKAEAVVADEDASRTRLERLLEEVRALELEIASLSKAAKPKVAELRELLEALGPPPELGKPPEDVSVSSRRFELEERLALVESRIKQAELQRTRAKQLANKILQRLHAELTGIIFERGPSPLSLTVLKSAGPHLMFVLHQLYEAPLEVWMPVLTGKVRRDLPLSAAVLAVLMLALGIPVRRSLLRRFVRDRNVAQPSFGRRLKTAVMIGFARGVVPALVVATPLIWIIADPTPRGIVGDMVVAMLFIIMFVAFGLGLALAALAPYSPSPWRLTTLTDESARALYRRISLLLWLTAVLLFIEYPATRHLEIPGELALFYDFIGNTVFAIILLSLLPGRLWHTLPREKEPESGKQPRGVLRRPALGRPIRLALALVAIAIPISALIGYTNLSTYLTDNIFLTGAVLGVLVVFHGLARDVTTLILDRETGWAAAIRATLGATDSNSRILQFWLMLVFDLTLFVIGALALMSLWGVSWADMREGIKAVGEGIQIGGLTISAGDIAVAILVFVVMLVITRWFQRVLEDRVFPQTSLDIGVRHSLKTVTGYVGLTLAVFMAIAALGIDLSNLALIAGALSVGIGFGLQSVVNNFVSGLILLAERPVKVGDWVVVGQHQGYVKRINVRATEIQTFQRSSVIIPNSEMVSGALVNWTHKDTYARVDIKVGVAYGSDTEKVRDILLKCAHDHPRANAWPEPFVLFQNFGESSLDFELRFFIGQADEVFRIGSDIRFAIDKGFRENGITIPFPQRDLHIQDIDRLADLMGNDAKTDGSTRRQRNNPKDGPPASQKGQDAPT